MEEQQPIRLSEAELREFLNRMFPDGFAGAAVVREIAPEQWENSPLFACFHPSPEQVLEEWVQRHRRMRGLRGILPEKDSKKPEPSAGPEPTIDEVLADWQDEPVNITEEVTDLVGKCLWDIFSDNHDVIASDGRLVEIGSFRAASAFLDGFLAGPGDKWKCGDEYRFYMGSTWIARRADLTGVYRMIFRRLKLLGADWQYHFPQVYLVDLSPLRQAMEQQERTYSPSEAFAKQQEELQRQAELEKAKEELQEVHNQARREAMDGAPPETVQAYQEVYGRNPQGWPPWPG